MVFDEKCNGEIAMKNPSFPLIVCFAFAYIASIGSVSAQTVANGNVLLMNNLDVTQGGEVLVTDPGSMLEVTNYIAVCEGGAFDYGNHLLVNNGGSVRCLGSMHVNGTVSTGVDYNWLYSYASITGTGSSLDIGGDLSLWSPDLPTRTPGTFDAWGVPCHIEISEGAEAWVGSTLSIANSSWCSVSSGSRLTIGSNPAPEGALTIASDGQLEMKLGEYAERAGYDHLTVSGDANLNGTFDVTLLNGYSPTNGTSFNLFGWQGSVNGQFATTHLPALAGGLQWDTSKLYSDGQLNVIPEPGTSTLIAVFGCGFWFVRRLHIV